MDIVHIQKWRETFATTYYEKPLLADYYHFFIFIACFNICFSPLRLETNSRRIIFLKFQLIHPVYREHLMFSFLPLHLPFSLFLPPFPFRSRHQEFGADCLQPRVRIFPFSDSGNLSLSGFLFFVRFAFYLAFTPKIQRRLIEVSHLNGRRMRSMQPSISLLKNRCEIFFLSRDFFWIRKDFSTAGGITNDLRI